MSMRRWKYLGRGTEAYVDADGEIIGEVSEARIQGGWYAERNGRMLGRFITIETAKKAVEGAPA